MQTGYNIFGKRISDYKHLATLEKKDAAKFKDHLDGLKAVNPQVFDAKVGTGLGKWQDDSQGIGFLTNNMMAILTEIEEVKFTNFRLPGLIQAQTAIPEGATSYAYKVMNSFGQGKFVENYGTDAVGAQVSMGLVNANLFLAGMANSWSLEDLRNAAFTGFALDTKVLEAATFGCLKHIESVELTGDTSKSLLGLVNQTGVTILAAGANWSASVDGQSIVDNMNTAVNAIIENSNEVFGSVIKMGMTIYLPVKQFNKVTTMFYGVNKDKSVANWFKENNAWTARTGTTIDFKSVIELKGAGVSGVDRALFGFNNREVMEYGQAISPRVTSIVNMGNYYNAPLEYKISGLNVKQPGGLIYMDGI